MLYQGRVKWFNNQKGFGFVDTEQGDVFVHYKDINGVGFRTLHENQLVQFRLEQTEKGFKALEVVALEEAVTTE